MRRGSTWRKWALALGGIAAAATPVLAEDFWHRLKLDWRRNNFWPRPFVQADRAAVRQPFAVMNQIGWRLQNTLGDDFFDPATHCLTEAGQLKIRWILTEAPSSRRTIYVLIGDSDQTTSARVDSVQQTVASMCGAGAMPNVLLTDREPHGGSGDYYNALQQSWNSSIPAPRLPPGQTNGGVAGSAGGGS